MSGSVERLVADDLWTVGSSPEGAEVLATVRFRQPILNADETGDYGNVVRCVWAYAEEGSNELPDEQTSSRMGTLENAMSPALECDLTAVLTAVLTFDGARQWVFYTADVEATADRINNALGEFDPPFPIEFDSIPDPGWDYLRNDILGGVTE